jgi:hypothetical protein
MQQIQSASRNDVIKPLRNVTVRQLPIEFHLGKYYRGSPGAGRITAMAAVLVSEIGRLPTRQGLGFGVNKPQDVTNELSAQTVGSFIAHLKRILYVKTDTMLHCSKVDE